MTDTASSTKASTKPDGKPTSSKVGKKNFVNYFMDYSQVLESWRSNNCCKYFSSFLYFRQQELL